MRILLVEDNLKLARLIQRGLNDGGHIVELADEGESGLLYAETSNFDLLILDVMLPGEISGTDVCRILRKQGMTTPIFMLTAKTHIGHRIEGLDAGADDYLCKPFSITELKARIRSLQRRQANGGQTVVEISGVTVDTVTHEVTADGNLVALTAMEYRALDYFITHPGRVLTRIMIEEHVWGGETDHVSNTMDSLIKRLRRRLGWNAGTGPIQTIRGEGYRLKIP
ncbi:MAG: response regulator transcription factor [Dehalogenimonas sp.]|uniref:Response regulator transcription factor n=1 Tax=Candidatus Dehalogenimonas loeffleri TaxID=3127115 RepID=A0ABZ2J774_9CHLR|nr:response regulator transcription factor [Dehalogenimonas sp.]